MVSLTRLLAATLLDVASAQWGGDESGFAPGWNGSEPESASAGAVSIVFGSSDSVSP
eukprot:COSAG02_NODE_3524_length_6615_cov_6.371393_2_plen_57_part_00